MRITHFADSLYEINAKVFFLFLFSKKKKKTGNKQKCPNFAVCWFCF